MGGGIAGIFEIGLFHPIDTLTKRTMYNKEKMSRKNLSQILFKEYSDKNILDKYKSLYTGAKFGMFYKILQRTYKYGGQSVLNEKLKLIGKNRQWQSSWPHRRQLVCERPQNNFRKFIGKPTYM